MQQLINMRNECFPLIHVLYNRNRRSTIDEFYYRHSMEYVVAQFYALALILRQLSQVRNRN